MTQRDRVTTLDDHGQLVLAPALHTAAAYKMLNCWPRLRLQLTLPGVQAMTYLKHSDESDPSLVRPVKLTASPRMFYPTAVTSFKYLYDHSIELPFPLPELVRSSSQTSAEHILATIPGYGQHADDEGEFELEELSIEHLILLSIVLPLSTRNHPHVASSCFEAALQRHWTLHAKGETDLIRVSLMIVTCLVHQWARPFHALGILQSVQAALERLWTKSHNDDVAIHSARLYARVYYILESDILSEIDGFTVFQTTTQHGLSSDPATSSAHHSDTLENSFPLDAHLYLRICLNSILENLYSPEKAYAQPYEIADLVQRSEAKLRDWYRSLPLSQQFVRDLSTFTMSVSTLSLQQVNTGIYSRVA